MEYLLGLKGDSNSITASATTVNDETYGYRLVPWMSWDEWDSVRLFLFSSSPVSVASAISRIVAWRSRGCLPVVIEVTAAIIEIQQKDPYFRLDLKDDKAESEEMLAMLYSMAVMRLVNGVVEKKRKKTKVSIADAACEINLPRMLIDIRHEGSHRDLPSLRLLRLASTKAVEWLISYYWDPQKKAIPYQRGECGNVRKEIKSKLRELASIIKENKSVKANASPTKGKRGKHPELLCGRNKLFSLMARKVQPSKKEVSGTTKQVAKTLKRVARLYSFFSSDLVYVILGLLLKAPKISDSNDWMEKFEVSLSTEAMKGLFDEWKPVIMKLSKKEPEMLLNLLRAVIDMVVTRDAMKEDAGGDILSTAHYDSDNQQIQILSLLFAWLVELLKVVKNQHATESSALPEATLAQLVRKCLLAFRPGNDHLLRSSVLLSEMIGGNKLREKLKKLSVIAQPHHDLPEDGSVMNPHNFIRNQDKCICEASKKLDLMKLRRRKRANSLTNKSSEVVESTGRWTVAESWNACPIGMLPRTIGSSGRLPFLDRSDDSESTVLGSKDEVGNCELKHFGNKREATSCMEQVNNVKKMRHTVEDREVRGESRSDLDHLRTTAVDCNVEPDDGAAGMKGKLMIGGVWRKVDQDELQIISSAIKVLV